MNWEMIGALAASFYTFFFLIALWFAYVQTEGFEKSRKLQATLTIFNELYTEVARKARKKVYKEVPVEIEGIEDEKLESYLEIVQDACFTYHRIGYLISRGYIDSDTIITTHWRTIWRCWKKSENLIKWAQIKRNNPDYLEYFKHMFDLSEDYRIRNQIEELKIYTI